MFRQRIPECTCQLFNSPSYQVPKFRSPPAHLNRQQVKSKRSLKSQSNSKNKHMHETNQLQEKVTQLSNRKLVYQNIPKKAGEIPTIVTHRKYFDLQQRTQVVAMKSKKMDNLMKISKENQPISFQGRNHPKIASPDQHSNTNMDRPIYQRLGGHFRGSQLEERVYNLSPTLIVKNQKINCPSAGTTLAGSVAPSIQEIQTKPIYYGTKVLEKQTESENSQKFNIALEERSQHDFGTLRLSEMMNKVECQSVYDGDKTLNSEKVEESRVLISCKKLMQQKNGFLEASDQNRLFDFYKESKERNRRSNIFQKLSLTKPSSN